MNKAEDLNVGIHTEQINTTEEITTAVKGIDIEYSKRNAVKKMNSYRFNINTNADTMVRDLKQFMEVKCAMIEKAELKTYSTVRVDVAIDSSVVDFQTNYFINKVLIQMVGLEYDIEENDDYRTVNNRTNKPKSNKLKSRAFDIENYDKAVESPDGNILNRLEFRVKQISRMHEVDKEVKCLNKVIKILEKSITEENFNELIDMNTETILRYIAEEGKKDTAVLSQNIDLIISKQQLIDIFTAQGYSAPDRKANKWIVTNKPQLLKYKDLERYSKQIIRAIEKLLKTA